MSILWCGGEDIDFPNGGGSVAVNTGNSSFRSSYARCSVNPTDLGTQIASLPFAGGGITSAWLSAQVWISVLSGGTGQTNYQMIGLSAGANSPKGLYVGITATSGASSVGTLALFTYDGTTLTLLAKEAGNSISLSQSNAPSRLDMSVSSYGATGTVQVYWNGALLITFTGNIALSGVSSLNTVSLWKQTFAVWNFSEIIVANSSTRTLSLATLVPNGAGNVDSWTGSYTNVNETTINDASSVYTNTAAQNEAFTLSDLPAGTFYVQAVKVTARASVSAGAAVSEIAVGVYSESTLEAGTLVAQTTAFVSNESLLVNNPVTGLPWTQTDVNALQINLQSN